MLPIASYASQQDAIYSTPQYFVVYRGSTTTFPMMTMKAWASFLENEFYGDTTSQIEASAPCSHPCAFFGFVIFNSAYGVLQTLSLAWIIYLGSIIHWSIPEMLVFVLGFCQCLWELIACIIALGRVITGQMSRSWVWSYGISLIIQWLLNGVWLWISLERNDFDEIFIFFIAIANLVALPIVGAFFGCLLKRKKKDTYKYAGVAQREVM